jgi:hypothetical protein
MVEAAVGAVGIYSLPMYPSAVTMAMHPANDCTHPYEDAGHLVLHTRLKPILCAGGIAADTALLPLPRVIVGSLACALMF